MSNTRTISAIILLAIGLLGDAGRTVITTVSEGPGTATTGTSAAAEITIRNETDNQQPVEIVDWAVERYELAGLRLPAGEIVFYPFDPSLDDCAGHGGLHTVGEGGHRIDICAVGVPSRRRLMLHEFAHAWTHENLSQGQLDAFLSMRGLENWNDPDSDWDRRGTEHASEIITWGLNRRCDPRHMLQDENHDSLAAAFELLTGTEPLCQPG